MCRKTTLTSNTHFLSTSVCTCCLHRSTLLVYTTFYLGNHVLSLLDEDIKAGCQTEISFSPPLRTALVNWEKSKRDDEQSMAWPVIRGSFFFFCNCLQKSLFAVEFWKNNKHEVPRYSITSQVQRKKKAYFQCMCTCMAGRGCVIICIYT